MKPGPYQKFLNTTLRQMARRLHIPLPKPTWRGLHRLPWYRLAFACIRYRRALRKIAAGAAANNPQTSPSLAAVLEKLRDATNADWESLGYRTARWHDAQIARKALFPSDNKGRTIKGVRK